MAFNLKALALTGAMLVLALTVAIAQPPGGGRQGGFGFGGFGGPATVSSSSVDVLAAGLKLTADQKTKIGEIQKQTAADRTKMIQDLRAGGPQPDQNAFQAFQQKMQDMNKSSDKKVTDALTPDQQKLLPSLLKDVQTLNSVGIPSATMADLKLTDDQKKKLTAIAETSQKAMTAKVEKASQNQDFQAIGQIVTTSRKATKDKALAVLTDDQKKTIAKYEKDHPQQPGRFGGFGGGGRPAGGQPPPPLA